MVHSPRYASVPSMTAQEALRMLRSEVLSLEDEVPWNAVRRTWRARRTGWRRGVKQSDAVPALAERLRVRGCACLHHPPC